MAITLITPAAEWVLGATVSFSFTVEEYAQNRDILNITPAYPGTYGYTSAYCKSLIFGEDTYSPPANPIVERVLWTQAQIDAWLAKDGTTWGLTMEEWSAGLDYMLVGPPYGGGDAYINIVSLTPDAADLAILTQATYTEETVAKTLYEGGYSYVEDRLYTVYHQDGTIHTGPTASQITSDRSIYLEADEIAAWLATLGISYNYVQTGPHPSLSGYTYRLERDVVRVGALTGETIGTASGRKIKTRNLPATTITVVATIIKDLPDGGMYLFSPMVIQDLDFYGAESAIANGNFGGIFSYLPDNDVDVESRAEIIYVADYETLLVDPSGLTAQTNFGSPILNGKFKLTHDPAGDLTVDDEIIAEDVTEYNIAPKVNTTYTYQWDDEDERQVRIVAGVCDRPMKHQIAGTQRKGDTIWRP